MHTHLRGRFRVEFTVAGLSAGLFTVTLFFPDWIEATTGLEPDAGSGTMEALIAGTLLLAAIGSAILALRDSRRLAERSHTALMWPDQESASAGSVAP